MPCTIKLRIVEARDLPAIDRSTKMTDPYVNISFGNFEGKTKIVKKTLNPVFDEEFRIDIIDESILQTCPMEFHVMDHDTYITDPAIGNVYVDLNILLQKREEEGMRMVGSTRILSGWYPIYDTIEGIRGELSLIIRLQSFGDTNHYGNLSTDVLFFGMSSIEHTQYTVENIVGFVEELVVHADPEYSWSDTFRSSRKSNEYRQSLLYKLSLKISSLISKKTIELCGNAVLGYAQHFDTEGDSGIVARAYGTACRIRLKVMEIEETEEENEEDEEAQEVEGSAKVVTDLPIDCEQEEEEEEERDSAIQKFTSKLRAKRGSIDLRAEDIQIYSLKSFDPSKTKIKFGGLVNARSVKYLGKLATNLADQETRDSWWSEIREEICSHALSLQCTHVIGYSETCTISDDVCVLSASGTAAKVTFFNIPPPTPIGKETPVLRRNASTRLRRALRNLPCSVTHVPYNKLLAPFSNMRMVRCGICGRKWVPETLMTTTEIPAGIAIVGDGRLIQARVCRQKTKGSGDANAVIVSEALPFLEYELFRQLSVKMKVYGVNAVFRLDIQIQIGESIIVAVLTGTAVYLPALPPASVLRISRNIEVKDEEDRRLVELQKKIEALCSANRQELQASPIRFMPLSIDMFSEPVSESGTPKDHVNKKQTGLKRNTSKYPKEKSKTPTKVFFANDEKDFNTERAEELPLESTEQLKKSSSLRVTSKNIESYNYLKNMHSFGNMRLEKQPKPSRRLLSKPKDDGYRRRRKLTNEKESYSSSSSSSGDSSSDSEEEEEDDEFQDSKEVFVLEIDDETDEDIMSVLLEMQHPQDIRLCNTQVYPGTRYVPKNLHMVMAVRRALWGGEDTRDTRLNENFSIIFSDVFSSLVFKMRSFTPCVISGIQSRIKVNVNDIVEVFITGMALLSCEESEIEEDSLNSVAKKNMVDEEEDTADSAIIQKLGRTWVELTPLSYVPGRRVLSHLGRVCLHFIKESWAVREGGGFGNFYHLFLNEALSITRAHVASIGGNALLAFRLIPIESSGQLYRNQVYNMISVSGDAVCLEEISA